MPNTPALALPYPSLTDTADVPRDIQALAMRLDIGISAPLVSSLPGSPVDGQEILYQADATNGIVWHFRYRAASASTYKWEFVGGAPLYDEVSANSTPAVSTPYVDLSPTGPTVTVPLAGDYTILFGANLLAGAAGGAAALAGIKIGSTAVADVDAIHSGGQGGTTGPGASGSREIRRNAPAANTVMTMQGRSIGTAAVGIRWRNLSVRPVRVG